MRSPFGSSRHDRRCRGSRRARAAPGQRRARAPRGGGGRSSARPRARCRWPTRGPSVRRRRRREPASPARRPTRAPRCRVRRVQATRRSASPASPLPRTRPRRTASPDTGQSTPRRGANRGRTPPPASAAPEKRPTAEQAAPGQSRRSRYLQVARDRAAPAPRPDPPGYSERAAPRAVEHGARSCSVVGGAAAGHVQRVATARRIRSAWAREARAVATGRRARSIAEGGRLRLGPPACRVRSARRLRVEAAEWRVGSAPEPRRLRVAGERRSQPVAETRSLRAVERVRHSG